MKQSQGWFVLLSRLRYGKRRLMTRKIPGAQRERGYQNAGLCSVTLLQLKLNDFLTHGIISDEMCFVVIYSYEISQLTTNYGRVGLRRNFFPVVYQIAKQKQLGYVNIKFVHELIYLHIN